ncbi:hypothetical protein COW20_11375 [bacterium (Candidatus Blackallbacteria) CG13_big_fil_rev_8_21_14_2_50_49_14]|nr:MAG: hypothetical protein COW20_11375 [bacterium (Candidatus Blackallbacteria) CG13_big_fil_rev_8_21_14_2_50_49_14]
MTSGTYGADQAVALNANNGWAFFNDALDGNTASEKVYGLSASTTLDAASGLKNFTANFNPVTGHQIMSPEIVLGATNPTGNSEKASLFYLDIEQVGSSNTGRVHALDQSNATEIWSYTFPFSINNYGSSDKVHAPLLLWRDQGVNPSCKCDDEDFVYTYINADSTHSGIYALKQARAGGAGTAADGTTGSQVWFYNLANNSITVSGGAVSKDGSKLYFVTNSSTASDLIILNRSDGSLVQTVSLGSGARVSPVIGTDGTVYVLSTSTSNSRLKAFNPDGSVKWTTDVNFGNVPFSHAPIVDRQNNKDVIYLISNKDQTTPSAQNAFIYAYWEDGTAKWTSPFRVTTSTENKVYAGLLVGAELDGSRLLYTGLSNAKLYAIRDKGTQGQLEWETSPGGTLWNGLNLRNGLLYVSTVDGGDRQFVLMHALKVSTPNVPASAPWPKTGGNLRNSGVSHTVDPEASNLRANSVS